MFLLVVSNMNRSEPPPYQMLSVKNDVFTTYSFWAGLLVLKMVLMSFFTAYQRIRMKVCLLVFFVDESKAERNVNSSKTVIEPVMKT